MTTCWCWWPHFPYLKLEVCHEVEHNTETHDKTTNHALHHSQIQYQWSQQCCCQPPSQYRWKYIVIAAIIILAIITYSMMLAWQLQHSSCTTVHVLQVKNQTICSPKSVKPELNNLSFYVQHRQLQKPNYTKMYVCRTTNDRTEHGDGFHWSQWQFIPHISTSIASLAALK